MKINSFAFVVIMLFCITSIYGQKVPSLNLEATTEFLKVPIESNLITPTGVAMNSKNHLFVVNAGAYKLMEFDAKGNFVRALANGILAAPHGIRIDKYDNIWVTDVELHIVIKLSPEGRILMVLGQKGKEGVFDEERQMTLFFKPADVAFGQNEDIYVADGYGNSRIVKLNKYGEFIKAWGQKGIEEGEFDNPHNIVLDQQGFIYVADRHNERIQIFNSDGEFQKSWSHLGKPWGLAMADDQTLYMTDGTNEKILKLDLKGNILGQIGTPGSKQGQFRAIHGIEVDSFHNLYITDLLNWRIQKLSVASK